MNGLKTAVLLVMMTATMFACGWLIAGRQGMILGFLAAILFGLFSYYFSDKLVLSMYSARPLSMSSHRDEFLRVHPILRNLCDRMLLPSPGLWLLPDPSPNALVVGRDPRHCSLCLTAGLLELLDDVELEAVMAHELGHIVHGHILTSSVVATLGSAITFLPQNALFFGSKAGDDEGSRLKRYLLWILGPAAAAMVRLFVWRGRAFQADQIAIRYATAPEGLIYALQKLENWSKRIPMDATFATGHLFIIRPFTIGLISRIFNTHPETQERLDRLSAEKVAVTQ